MLNFKNPIPSPLPSILLLGLIVFIQLDVIGQTKPKTVVSTDPNKLYNKSIGLLGHQTLNNEETWFAGENQYSVINAWTRWCTQLNYEDLYVETPINLHIIEIPYKVYPYGETDLEIFHFEDFKKQCFDYFTQKNLFEFESRGSYLLQGRSNESIAIIKKSAATRKSLVDYAIKCFTNLEGSFPNTWKKYFIKRIDKLILFTNNIKLKRSEYNKFIKNEYNNGYNIDFIDLVGFYEAFIFRRIEYDGIPAMEITGYLKSMQQALKTSITPDSSTNYFNLYINNTDLIISDKDFNWNGLQVEIWSENSKKGIIINGFYGLKCIKQKEKTYYLIYSEEWSNKEGKRIEKTTLIDTELNIIPT